MSDAEILTEHDAILAEIRSVMTQGTALGNLLWLRSQVPWLLDLIEHLRAEVVRRVRVAEENYRDNIQHDEYR